MYGIIHAGLKALVEAERGTDGWSNVLGRAGQSEPATLVYSRYDDAATMGLVQAAAAELGVTVPEALRSFGRHWIRWAAGAGYGAWLAHEGSLFDALDALDDMHTRLAVVFPGYRPPSFAVTRLHDRAAEVRWRSERSGLAPMVIGILEGLGEHRAQPCRVATVEERADGATFLVTLEDAA